MYEYDASLVFISLELAQKLLLLDNRYFNRIEYYINDPLLINNFKKKIDSIILAPEEKQPIQELKQNDNSLKFFVLYGLYNLILIPNILYSKSL